MNANDKRTEYGYAGMNREQAYRAYMGLTCDNPPVSPEEREDRIVVLTAIMAEHMNESGVTANG